MYGKVLSLVYPIIETTVSGIPASCILPFSIKQLSNTHWGFYQTVFHNGIAFNSTANLDYQPTTQDLQFSPSGNQLQFVFVTILLDTLIEDPETINLQLSSTLQGLIIQPGSATITIQDNDGMILLYLLYKMCGIVTKIEQGQMN